ncbi:MAG: hypothetical protein JW967_05305 [Dehalococcoidales bacterium]|nr:hypothetical protein [Dehalococcoidales bacterium]
MERQEFIAKDPLTAKIVDLLRRNPRNGYTVEEIAEEILSNVTTRQVQMVISLLNKEGMVKTSMKGNKPAYQIKT